MSSARWTKPTPAEAVQTAVAALAVTTMDVVYAARRLTGG